MEIKVQGKLQELKFGVGFVRRLDKKYFQEREGVEFGLGLNLAYPLLIAKNITALSDVISCALPGTVSVLTVDNSLDAYADEFGGLGTLFDEVLEGLENSNSLKDTVQAIAKEVGINKA